MKPKKKMHALLSTKNVSKAIDWEHHSDEQVNINQQPSKCVMMHSNVYSYKPS